MLLESIFSILRFLESICQSHEIIQAKITVSPSARSGPESMMLESSLQIDINPSLSTASYEFSTAQINF